MTALVIHDARIVTPPAPDTPGAGRRGGAMGELRITPRGHVLIRDGVIASIWTDAELAPPVPADAQSIDARGRALLPGFVDCHTHLCHAGSRIGEWERVLAGESYQQIAAGGGGIMSSVRATRAASRGELACDLIGRADRALATGSTTIEVKSGYGLTTEPELNMLRAVREAGAFTAATLVPTALLGHAIDPGFEGGAAAFVKHTIERTLPSVSAEFPAIGVDAFCERSAWDVEQTVALLEAAAKAGHPLRVHADQFTSMGMVRRGVWLKARSVDHLESTTPDDARLLGSSETFGVILPCCGFHLDGRYASGRGLIDAGVKLALATNANPGSAPCTSVPMAIALAVRFCRLSVSEAISAVTLNGAGVLGLSDRGWLGVGARADMILLHDHDERSIAYEFGANPVALVIAGGRVIEP